MVKPKSVKNETQSRPGNETHTLFILPTNSVYVTQDELGKILGHLRNQKLHEGEIHSLHYTCAFIGTSFYAKHQIVVSTRKA